MNLEQTHLESTEGEATSWLAPLYVLVAWLAHVFGYVDRLKRLRHTSQFRPDWRDHFDNLRTCEWHREQVIGQCLQQLLDGKELDLGATTLIWDPPPGYGGPCPRTPQDMNRRFISLGRWRADAYGVVEEHARRFARRLGIDFSNPFAVHGSTGALRAAHHEAVAVAALTEAGGAPMVSSARSARPSTWRAEAQRRRQDARVLTQARGPPQKPYSLLPIPYSLRSASF